MAGPNTGYPPLLLSCAVLPPPITESVASTTSIASTASVTAKIKATHSLALPFPSLHYIIWDKATKCEIVR